MSCVACVSIRRFKFVKNVLKYPEELLIVANLVVWYDTARTIQFHYTTRVFALGGIGSDRGVLGTEWVSVPVGYGE